MGRVGRAPADAPRFLCSPQTTFWRSLAPDALDQDFLHAFVASPAMASQLRKHMNESDMAPYVSLTTQRGLALSLPPVQDQRRIGSVYRTLNDRIDNNRRLVRALEELVSTLFRSWFVEWDPVRAKVNGRQPIGMDTGVAALFPDRFEDSEIGPIPEGWKLGLLRDLADLNPESWSKASRPSTIRYVDLTNAKLGRIEAVVDHSADQAPSRAQRVLRPGDTLVGTVRPANGSFALVTEGGLTGSTGFAVLRARRLTDVGFVYSAATSRESIERLAHLADGAAYPAVRPGVVAALEITIPPDEVRDAFATVWNPLSDRVVAAQRESRTLAELRDLLLPELISGRLRVKDLPAEITDVSADEAQELAERA